ncbi:GAF domain-containing sensor histidine kinase [Chengkuizengella axinellae]|uniref:Oxygen sensor histidine kinase NreB n=1 Tax=Chengkuizengella axinellae TaxID=3064388 RepID=A0ABT9J2T9_9BACL|nr:GAF domain-containing sensor histidine kinase [Chengkuizengella sp. 2205SS18-9]MDP5275934.1 GAF domain-containing sensor histidine kinase [Chengkuizengella sp. 2205SS18-9]
MVNEKNIQKLNTLKVILQTINQVTDLDKMLQSVLNELIHLMDLKTGWIYFIDPDGNFKLVTDYELPPALSYKEKRYMCEGDCWCIDRYHDGRLDKAANIIECKRIEDAIENDYGDTEGVTHHATIPLKAGNEKFGLLNVASPNKLKFNEEELALLESVAIQIGTAIKRLNFMNREQKRAHMFQKLGEVSTSLHGDRNENYRLEYAASIIQIKFQYDQVMIECNERVHEENKTSSEEMTTFTQTFQLGETTGKITISNPILDDIDQLIIEQLSQHLAIIFEHARLNQKGHELALIQERNRLARDLHDSVNQLLFSLMLTVRGTKEMTEDEDIHEMLNYMQELSQDALKEMKALIWQLRPQGLEEGVVCALVAYGKVLGLKVSVDVQGVGELPSIMEECLWRIGQEALNNIKKHAETTEVCIEFNRDKKNVEMNIHDNGVGFNIENGQHSPSLGLKSMRERADLFGGNVVIQSVSGKGTLLKVSLPMAKTYVDTLSVK